MSDPINESFSALLDDQATSMDVQRLLNAMHDQPNKIKQWHGLAQCQGQLQNEVCVDLLDGIHSRLYGETDLEHNQPSTLCGAVASDESVSTSEQLNPLQSNHKQSVSPDGANSVEQPSNAASWVRPLAKIAVAASVCLFGLLGFVQWQQPQVGFDQSAAVATSNSAVAISRNSAEIQQRFQQLMQQRSQQAAFSLPATENQWRALEQ